MQNQKYKTIMCKYYNMDKPCPLGSRCHFSHGKEELRRISDPLPVNAPMLPNSKLLQVLGAEGVAIQNPVVINNYKTVVCKYWEQGKCKYQQKCSFAHGDCEIRNQDTTGGPGSNSMLDPLKIPALEYLLRQQQLSMICASIVSRYGEDKDAMGMVTQASELLSGWKINNAAEILLKFIYNPTIEESEKKERRRIVDQSVQYAEQFLENCKSEEFQAFLAKIMQQQNSLTPMLYGTEAM